MAVKAMRSGRRLLDVLEEVAERAPIGVSELSRALGEEKSTVQRMLATLAEAGWIRAAPGSPTRWEMSGRVHIVAARSRGVGALCRRARPVLAGLRDLTGETALLALREGGLLVVAEVAESADEWRLVPRIGNVVPDRPSVSALALAPYLDSEERAALLGSTGAAGDSALASIRAAGFAVQTSERGGGSINIAAAVFDGGVPAAAVVLSAPAARLAAERVGETGRAVAAAARSISAA